MRKNSILTSGVNKECRKFTCDVEHYLFFLPWLVIYYYYFFENDFQRENEKEINLGNKERPKVHT